MVVMHDRSNRFEPYNVGFINFWVYENEVYPFRKGNILFRGPNGQGKSVSMQSIIPLLLDGNTHPSRIDPFGSGKRKIVDYLATDGQTDLTKIAYLYITYKKITTNEIVTTGIGLQAKKDDKVDFWGFVVHGAEVGKTFFLTKTLGFNKDGAEEFTPLSKDELKRQIEEMKCGRFVNSQKDYAEEVNKQVFQFENVELFKELTKLLIQIRSPKLSKEMKPDVLYDALKRSLGELPSAEFGLISSTIKDIDDHNRKLGKTEVSLELSIELSEEYKNYRRAMLGHASKRYLESVGEKESLLKKYNSSEKKLLSEMGKLKKVSERLEQIKVDIDVKQSKLNMLESSETRSLRNEREHKKVKVESKEVDLKNKERQYDMKTLQRTGKDKELKEADNKTHELEKKIKDVLEDLKDLTVEIQFKEGELFLTEVQKTLNDETDEELAYFQTWLHLMNKHVDNIKEVMKSILEEERLLVVLNQKKEEIRKTASEIEQTEKDLHRLNKEFEAIKSSYKKDFHSWVKQNCEFNLTPSHIGNVMEIVENLYDFTNMTPGAIHELLGKRKDQLMVPLRDAQITNKFERGQLEEKIRDLKAEKERIETEKESIPYFRREETVENRKQLSIKGIPHVSFYEAVDFNEEVSESEKERIESALLDMGLLDALIVPSAYLLSIDNNDAVIVPKVCEGNVTLHSILKPVIPDGSSITEEDIISALESISLDKLEGTVYLTKEGHYRTGLVQGHAVTQNQSSFIGKETRKRIREQKIADIKTEIERNRNEIKHLETNYNVLNERIKTLTVEYEAAPLFLGLEDYVIEKEVANSMKERYEKQKKELYIAYEDVSTSYKKAQNQKIITAAFLEGPKEKEAIIELLRLAEKEYSEKVRYLYILFKDLTGGRDRLRLTKDALQELEVALIELKGEMNSLDSEIKMLKGEIESIEELLNKMNADEEEKEVETLRKDISSLVTEKDRKIEEKPVVESEIKYIKEQRIKLEHDVAFAKQQLIVQEEILISELKVNRLYEEDSLSQLATEYTLDAKVEETISTMEQAVHVFRSKDLESYLITVKRVVVGSTELREEDYQAEKKDRINRIDSERKRLSITIFVDGAKKNPIDFQEHLHLLAEQQRLYLKKDEEKLIKNVIIQGIGEKIKDLISKANKWKDSINEFMKSLDNSIDLRLTWEPIDKTDKDTEDYLTTSKLVQLLGRDFSTLREVDIETLSKHFLSKINFAKERLDRKSNNKESVENLEQALKLVLDYRDWYKFKIFYKLEGDKEKVLDEKNLNILSGGEKAMAIYIPLFSAAYSKYITSSPDAPFMIALDEAFAGVDEDNVSEMFALMEQMGFNYILTSQFLWGDYPTVPGINIYEMSYDKIAKFVFSEPWKWDGHKRTINEEVLWKDGIYINDENRFAGDPVQESLFD